MATSDDYTPCAVIDTSGRVTKGTVKFVHLMPPEVAVTTLRAGKVAWVKADDAEVVIAQWQGRGE